MTTFIPFGLPNGNHKQISSEVFSVGQEIKVKATGSLAGATNTPLTKESAAVAIQAASVGFTATGVTDVADGGSGSKDTNPTVIPSGTGVDALTIRGNANGTPRIIIRFLDDTGDADRDAFKVAYPEGTPAMLTVEGVEYYSSSVSYSQGGGYLIIPGTDFDSFPDDVSGTTVDGVFVGKAYTFEISDDIVPPPAAGWETEGPTGALKSNGVITGSMTSNATLVTLPGVATNVFDNGGTNGFRWNNGLVVGNYPTDSGTPDSNIAAWNITDNTWWAPPVSSTVSYDGAISKGYKWNWDGSLSIFNKEVVVLGYDHYVDPIGDSWPDYDGPTS